MKYFLILWAIVFSAICLFAAYPSPPAGYAYETDLLPHSLVLTNAAAAGLANRSDIASATNALKSDMASALKPTAIYTPDGDTWTDATGCVWRVAHEDYWVVTYFDLRRPNARLEKMSDNVWSCPAGSNHPPYEICFTGTEWAISTDVECYSTYGDATNTATNTYLRAGPDGDTYGEAYRVMGAVTNLITRWAATNELAGVAATIPTIVTNVVRDVQGLVYDEKLGVTWRQVMHDGNLYYVAVTNANITKVK